MFSVTFSSALMMHSNFNMAPKKRDL